MWSSGCSLQIEEGGRRGREGEGGNENPREERFAGRKLTVVEDLEGKELGDIKEGKGARLGR